LNAFIKIGEVFWNAILKQIILIIMRFMVLIIAGQTPETRVVGGCRNRCIGITAQFGDEFMVLINYEVQRLTPGGV
jgi:hypothetical protein